MANSSGYHRRCSVFSLRSITSDDISFQKRSIFIKNWLLESARNNSERMREILKEQPSVAIEKDPFSGYTALHWAAKHGNIDIMKCLVKTYGANVNEKSHGGYTALHLSTKYRRINASKFLVNDLGANINIRDNYGKKPNYYTFIRNDITHRQQYVMKTTVDKWKNEEKKTSDTWKKAAESSKQIQRYTSLESQLK